MDESQADFTDQFWQLIEHNMGCVVPLYLQQILRVRGYDNAASIGTLTRDDIQQLQEFFKQKLKKNAEKDSSQDANQNLNQKKFFHAFHNDSDEFEILPGHLKLLDKIVSYINTMTESHGPGYFNHRSEKNIRKSSQKSDYKVAVVRKSNIRGEPLILLHIATSTNLLISSLVYRLTDNCTNSF